jgi:hypothetical protein
MTAHEGNSQLWKIREFRPFIEELNGMPAKTEEISRHLFLTGTNNIASATTAPFAFSLEISA